MKKVLLVDDDSDVLNLLNFVVKMHIKCAIDTADSGLVALTKIGENNYDAIICDYKLKDLGGCSVCRHVLEKNSETPVAIISADDEDEIPCMNDLRELGSSVFYLSKPFDNEDLLSILKQALQQL